MEGSVPGAAPISFEEALAQVNASLDVLGTSVVEPQGVDAALEVIRGVETVARRVGAVQVAVVGAIDSSKAYRPDGHRNAAQMVGCAGRLSAREHKRRGQAARAMEALPLVAAGFAVGAVGSCHVDRIARLYANPRIQDLVVDQDARLALLASRLGYDEFDAQVTAWEHLNDEDGTADKAAACHQNRRLRVFDEFNGGWGLDGRGGGLDGAEANAILSGFTDAEFAADWTAARAIYGDATTVGHLARTDDQRQWDAFMRICRLAAEDLAASAGGSVVALNVLIDQETYERELRRIAGDEPEPREPTDLDTSMFDDDPDAESESPEVSPEPGPSDGGEPVDESPTCPDAALDPDAHGDGEANAAETAPDQPSGGVGYRCGTADGAALSPREVVAATLLAHVRRVVMGADSVVIDLSRRQRLFTGSAALAARLNATHCYWPGCRVPASKCQIDHSQPWGRGGRTDPGNGAPCCGMHNRHKEHGFTVRRDKRGRIHVYRPDGTELTGFP